MSRNSLFTSLGLGLEVKDSKRPNSSRPMSGDHRFLVMLLPLMWPPPPKKKRTFLVVITEVIAVNNNNARKNYCWQSLGSDGKDFCLTQVLEWNVFLSRVWSAMACG